MGKIKLWGGGSEPPTEGAFYPTVLRRYREAAGLSVEDVARLAGISYSTVRYIEAGRHMPRADILAVIVYQLDVDPRELFAHRKEPPGHDHH